MPGWQMEDSTLDEWLTTTELAQRIGRSERTVRYWVAQMARSSPDLVKPANSWSGRLTYLVNVTALRDEAPRLLTAAN